MKKILLTILIALCIVMCCMALVSCDELQPPKATNTATRTVDATVAEITTYHTSSATMVILVYNSDDGRYAEYTTLRKYIKNPLITGDQVILPIITDTNYECEVGAYYNTQIKTLTHDSEDLEVK